MFFNKWLLKTDYSTNLFVIFQEIKNSLVRKNDELPILQESCVWSTFIFNFLWKNVFVYILVLQDKNKLKSIPTLV